MFDDILRVIWAILTASFVGLIIYFRKQLKSILHALSDVDSLKVWQLEFKRRKAINKVVKDIVASKSVSFSGNIAASSSVTGNISSKPKLLSVRIQQLEEENANLKRGALDLAAVAANISLMEPNKALAEIMKIVAKQLYKEVLAIDPESKFLENVSELLDLTTGDRIGVGEDTKVEVVGKDDVNASDEIPPEESQQSKP